MDQASDEVVPIPDVAQLRVIDKRTEDNLIGVHPDLDKVIRLAYNRSSVQFKVIEGVRTPERQRQLFSQGRTVPGKIVTKTLKSNHFVNAKTGFGHAVDVLPAPYDWKDANQFRLVAEVVKACAKELGVNVEWGGDWKFTDSPHFELKI